MTPRFLELYNQELRFIREMGVEFARRYPKIASRLDLGSLECADPYVERLLEGFAFLTARVHLKLEAEFPKFTQHLLEMVYPHYLAPTPAMTVVKFEPDLQGSVTEQGYRLPRHTVLRSSTALKGHVSCVFRTAHQVMLWPIKLSKAEYLPRGELGRRVGDLAKGARAGIRLCFETIDGIVFQQLPLDELVLYLDGDGEIAVKLYENLMARTLRVVAQPSSDSDLWRQTLGKNCISPCGFGGEEALLPCVHQSFNGYRYLQEYFALPQRFLFVKLSGLKNAVMRCDSNALELVVLLDREQREFEGLIDERNFTLYCAPAINLFPKRSDRIHLTHGSTEHHVVIDRTRPLDYEVYSVTGLTGYGTGTTSQQMFLPFYSLQNEHAGKINDAYYTLQRQPTLESSIHSGSSKKIPYLGSELFVSLVDGREAPFRHDLKQLSVEALCTNRGLPQTMFTGHTKTDFTLEIGAPVETVKCVAGPVDPRHTHREGEHAWRLVNHLSLNYLSLIDKDESSGATALRELLELYGQSGETPVHAQIEGVLNVNCQPIVSKIPGPGPAVFGRGLQVRLVLNESAFQGFGAFMLGMVLDRFFSKYVSINSFTQTVIETRERGEIMRWPVRCGTRDLI